MHRLPLSGRILRLRIFRPIDKSTPDQFSEGTTVRSILYRFSPDVCSSVQSLDLLGRRGDMTDDSAEILFKSFMQGPL